MSLISSDKLIGVIGLGRTGMATARYLKARGKRFFAVEENETSDAIDLFRREFDDVPLLVGKMVESEILRATELLVSPGIALDKPVLLAARQAGIDISCDIDVFAEAVSAPIVAITGSNAKSTVTALVGEMAAAAGLKVGVGGNIGTPALELILGDEAQTFDLFVLELSSFQLERMKPLKAAVASVLNISPDHMDRYEGLAQYHAAKHRIYFGCKNAVFNRGDALTSPLLPGETKTWSFGLDRPDFNAFGLVEHEDEQYLTFQFEELMPRREVRLLGNHNTENALAALAIGKAAGLPMAAMLDTLRTFGGLPHRCERVADAHGVIYINDSKGTNIGATIAAIKGFASPVRDNLVLIAGGVGKGADFELLAKGVVATKAAVTIGVDGPAIAAALQRVGVKTFAAASLDEAVAQASALADVGDVVLFSPACASFDMFNNYAHRGQCFAESVQRFIEGVEHG
ncbi:MAG TPA: UDP-N-acetylmuramoyl-L-alanine--D-glutamate ligase [Pseudomonadales bacterium]|nr:UDP-N-acetylmuramoyl-L-alanine--D-glutamate ligase [Pseudomonadales bacterium]